jgi:hypothetical protein
MKKFIPALFVVILFLQGCGGGTSVPTEVPAATEEATQQPVATEAPTVEPIVHKTIPQAGRVPAPMPMIRRKVPPLIKRMLPPVMTS